MNIMFRFWLHIAILTMPFCQLSGQNIGIGTTTPHAGSILDLGTSRPLLLPRLTSEQMMAVSPVTPGQLIYNTTEHQLYTYTRYRTSSVFTQTNTRWEPVSIGPRMLAYGIVDSFAVEIGGSNNFNVTWSNTDKWYHLNLTEPHEFFKDSMILLITPIGNGSWDQTVSIGEYTSGAERSATIKFTDVTRLTQGYLSMDARRRSAFYFVLYDLRKKIY